MEGSSQFDGETAAFLRQYENDEAARATPKFARKTLRFLSSKLKPIVGDHGVAILDLISAETQLNVVALTRCLVAEFARVGKDLDAVKDSQRALRILVNAADEARRAHDQEKIVRLAKIATTGILIEDEPTQKIDEFIRAAGVLIDADILVLNAIFDQQNEICRRNSEWVDHFSSDASQDHIHNALANRESRWSNEVFEAWKQLRHIPAGSGGSLTRSATRSAIVRLEALGFVADVSNNGVEGLLYGRPCGLLDLGYEFVEYLRCLKLS